MMKHIADITRLARLKLASAILYVGVPSLALTILPEEDVNWLRVNA